MSDYQTAADALPGAMKPVFEYCQRQHQLLDPADEKHHGRIQHVLQCEGLLNATRDFYKAAEGQREASSMSSSTAVILRVQKLLAHCDYLNDYPAEQRRDLSRYALAFTFFSQPHLTFPTITSHE